MSEMHLAVACRITQVMNLTGSSSIRSAHKQPGTAKHYHIAEACVYAECSKQTMHWQTRLQQLM